MTPAPASAKQDLRLPSLRAELDTLPGAPTHDGVPTWTVVDPVRNRYFQIGWDAYQLLSRWHCGSADRLIEEVTAATTSRPTRRDVEELIKFLYANNLTRDSASGGSRGYLAQAQAGHRHWLTWLIHNYLFFRLPLVKPDRFLAATLAFVAPLFTRAAATLVIVLGFVGIYLVSRQWETFSSTFLHFFNGEGLAWYAVALCLVKVCHELGHAYTAKRYGCRVPTMGIALLVLFPVLYTDTTDAWRLRSSRQRLFVGAAGIITELALASLATFLWSFLPEGRLRSVAFLLSTTSWVMAVMINVNPLLRFDGYYLLSDWLGVPNLQERAFAHGRCRLRRLLFGVEEDPPEHVSNAMRRKLIVYAWAVWVFRFFLFIGIALLVYHFFFKLLGIILFAVEIMWFIILPIARELKTWWEMRADLARGPRLWVLSSVLLALVALSLFPWSTRVSIPAVLEATHHATLYAPAPGRIVQVWAGRGQLVTKGDLLVTLESPALDRDIELTRKRVEVLELRARRRAANPEERANSQVVLQALRTQMSTLQGLLEKRRNLALTAPLDGIVTDVAESLHPGRWVNDKLALAYIVERGFIELEALAPETELPRLTVGQPARFIPDDPSRPAVTAWLREIRDVDEGFFAIPYLASVFGGDIPVRKDDQGRLQPDISVYRVRLDVAGDLPPPAQAVRGVVHVEGNPRSFAGRLRDLVASVLIRESGF